MSRRIAMSFSQFITLLVVISVPVAEFGLIVYDARTMAYLSKYGHINPPSGPVVDEELWKNAIKKFQRFAGLEVTGELNAETIQTMSVPRCGNRDANVITGVQIPTTFEGSDENLCTGPNISAIFNDFDGNTFVFKGLYYYKFTEDGIVPGYPRFISKTWMGLPGNIDTAFTYKNGKTYFFKGSKYWRFIGTKMDGDYPKEINEGFTGIPDNVDAALEWSGNGIMPGNGKMYFFKGDKFWAFDPTARPPVKSTYPKPISNWGGIPNNIDTAFQYTNGYTYFLKDGTFYRLNGTTLDVKKAESPFPWLTVFWWLGC